MRRTDSGAALFVLGLITVHRRSGLKCRDVPVLGMIVKESLVDSANTRHILAFPGCKTMRVLEDRKEQMDDKKTQKFRQRLLEEYQKLIRSINRNRLAEEEIKLENTEDEGDLATISHNKELLYNLHESDFQRLKSIQQAVKRMDRGEYGECIRCGEDINEKRLMAV